MSANLDTQSCFIGSEVRSSDVNSGLYDVNHKRKMSTQAMGVTVAGS